MLSGFQFVGIILEKNLSLTESNEMLSCKQKLLILKA